VARHLSGFVGEVEIRMPPDRYEFSALLPQADVCFCYGLSPYVNLKNSELKLIYLGIIFITRLKTKYGADGNRNRCSPTGFAPSEK